MTTKQQLRDRIEELEGQIELLYRAIHPRRRKKYKRMACSPFEKALAEIIHKAENNADNYLLEVTPEMLAKAITPFTVKLMRKAFYAGTYFLEKYRYNPTPDYDVRQEAAFREFLERNGIIDTNTTTSK